MRGKKRKSSEPRPLGLLQCRWPCQRRNCHASLSLSSSFSFCGVEAGHLSVSPTSQLSLSYHSRDRMRPLAKTRHGVCSESVLVSLCVCACLCFGVCLCGKWYSLHVADLWKRDVFNSPFNLYSSLMVPVC